ncbi:MAG: hypothetical protein KatS3mg101_0994 [Patescibacteria group bacterium]|nr:MAG: hypothetical protein KatS3mg101_0994 [Patescibacteria group bacterium]
MGTVDLITGQPALHKHGVNDIKTSNAPDSTKVLYGDGSWQEPPGATSGEANTGENVGTGEGLIYKDKVGVALRFKSLKQGTGAGVIATNSGTTATLLCYLDWMAVWFDRRALTR